MKTRDHTVVSCGQDKQIMDFLGFWVELFWRILGIRCSYG